MLLKYIHEFVYNGLRIEYQFLEEESFKYFKRRCIVPIFEINNCLLVYIYYIPFNKKLTDSSIICEENCEFHRATGPH